MATGGRVTIRGAAGIRVLRFPIALNHVFTLRTEGRSIFLDCPETYYDMGRFMQWGSRRGLRGERVAQALHVIECLHRGDPPAHVVLLNLIPLKDRKPVERALLRIAGQALLGEGPC
jgi:hypothetical protein